MECGKIDSKRALRRPIDAVKAALAAIFAFLCLCLIPQTAFAQVATAYNNTPAAAIAIPDNGCAAAATSVVRTFTVPTTYVVSDVNLGIITTHDFRGDLRITLSKGAKTVILTSGSGGAANNLNVTFDDEATGGAIGVHNADDPLAPVYNSTKIPAAALSLFDGDNANGVWTLTICDLAAADLGTFVRSTLTVTSAPAAYADLSLTKTVSNAAPTAGGTVDYTLTVTNAAASPTAAAGVTVTDILPAGTTFNSQISGTGTYNSGTGIWTLGAVPIGASRSIVIRVNVTAGAGTTITNSAEIRTSSVADLDATPNNGSTIEDDDASVAFTVAGTRVAGTPPILPCSVADRITFDWDSPTVAWASGNLTGTYPLTGVGDIEYTLANPGAWVTLASVGVAAPVKQTAVNGGTGQNSLFMAINLASRTQSATAVIKLKNTAVPGAQFTIFDVDFSAGQFSDRITVTGTYNGAAVAPPILTNGTANFVIGNSAYGDILSLDTQNNGNVVVTFLNPVDEITIDYGNHGTAPLDPTQQAISLHDLTFCRPVATLSVTKISSVLSDGVSGSNPKAIPGATVQYCITVQNNGTGTTANMNISDTIPATVAYVANSLRSGANCGTAVTVEDDDATDTGEADDTTASAVGTTITGTVSTLAPSSTKSLVFNTTVN
jgi:uncharacterized repeat protein (TIGR01451 family)